MLPFGALLLFGLTVACAWAKHYSIDEFQYAHASWLVARGAIPYVDFFEFHTPLPYQLGALVFAWLPDDPEGIRWLRLLNLSALLAILVSSVSLVKRWANDPKVRPLAPALVVCLLGTPEFVSLATEFRPDVLALAFFLMALAALNVWPDDRRAARVGGVCVGLAVWSSQKALLYGTIFALAFLRDVFGPRRHGDGRKLWLRAPGRFVLGFLLTAGLCAAYLLSTGSMKAWFDSCFVWAAYHERHYPGFSAWRYLGPTLLYNPVLVALAAIGVARTRQHRFWLVAGLLATLGSFIKARAPFPYALLPFLAMCAIAAALGSAALRSRRLALCALWSIALCGGARLATSIRDDNHAQHETLALLGRLTAPDEPVFDSSGQATARPHVGHRFYTSALIRHLEADALARDIPRDLRSSGCIAVLRDLRYDGLPASVKTLIEARYQPYTPDLWLWGRKLEPGALEVPRTGRYFIEPEAAFAHITIDGHVLREPEIELPAGTHSVAVDAAAAGAQAYLLWLPRDGQRWRPVESRAGTFSRLF